MSLDRQTNGHRLREQPTTHKDSFARLSSGRRWRAPTVNDALPFTPLSSIVPFDPNIIDFPLTLPPPTPSAQVQSQDERNMSRRILEDLGRGAANAENASKRCLQTLKDVQKLLEPDNLTQFRFKIQGQRNGTTNQSKQHPNKNIASRLSPFAKMVFDNTEVSYHLSDPLSNGEVHSVTTSSRGDHEPIRTAAQHQGRSGQRVLTPQIPIVKQPFAQHEHHPHKQSTPSKTPTAVVVADLLTPQQRAQYQIVHHERLAEAAPTAGRQNGLGDGTKSLSVDQRRKGDVATNHLLSLLSDIFEAEDQLQPDTSGLDAGISTFFATDNSDDGQNLNVLRAATHAQVESAVQKVSEYGRLEIIPVDSLVRLQKLCENSIVNAENANLGIGEDWNDEDVANWLERVGFADNSLTASRTLLRIMMKGPNAKELQSEDHLRQILNALKNTVESGIVPVVEHRATDSHKGPRIKGDKIGGDNMRDKRFVVACDNRDALKSLQSASRRTLRLLGQFLTKTDVDETSVSSTEFLCKTLIFAENGPNERDTALGVHSFEDLRRTAMDVLGNLFTRYPEQRQFILEEILVSLEKLPPSRQNARQYKLQDCKPIQLVSALLMRLVQTSACRHRTKGMNRNRDDEMDAQSGDDSDIDDSDRNEADAKNPFDECDLAATAKSLYDSTQSHCSYIIKMLLNRALTTAKNSEEPHRKLLDIFVEDFINVLGSADWPAAQQLLFTLLSHMVGLIDNNKTPTPSKTLALELLGTMGSGILELRATAKRLVRGIDTAESDLSARLGEMADAAVSEELKNDVILQFSGPYRVVLEYLQARGSDNDQLRSAFGYHLMQWAHELTTGRATSLDSDVDKRNNPEKSVHAKVRNILFDPLWLEENSDMQAVSTAQGRLAAIVLTLHSRFCNAFSRIFHVLLNSMTSEQSRIKSRSLKSVVTLIEQDASVLDRGQHVLVQIYRCATDPSPLVRDSALDLIAKCIHLRPSLDKVVCDKVVARSHDSAIGVRKRAMKLLKDIYLRNESGAMRASIANAILSRMHDSEESVLELARTIMEEIWFLPLQSVMLDGENNLTMKLHYRSQVALLVQTVERDQAVAQVLESLVADVLTKSKTAGANQRVCSTLVSVMFDGIIDNSDIPGSPPQGIILQTVAIFAKASPTLVTALQLERLEPYTQNLTKTDDLLVYSSVITILRHVIPHIDSLKPAFLENIQLAMQASVTKLPKAELAEVAPCLWTVTCLRQDFDRPRILVLSVLTNIDKFRHQNLTNETQDASRVIRLLHIAGQFGRACDFTNHLSAFKAKFPSFKGDSVAGLIVEILCAFASPKQPLAIREASIENICAVSQAWPKQFLRADVTNAFETVFHDGASDLEHTLLDGLAGFLCALEAPSPEDETVAEGAGVQTGAERIGRTYVASDSDGASTSLAQRFLPHIQRLALGSTGDLALIATRLITSIARQGMTHPKESGPALVALETSPNEAIAKLAYLEHRSMNSRFETMFDKEYMRAVQQAFIYQQYVVGNTDGFSGQPPVAKIHLLWEVLKAGKAAVRKKFLTNMCQKLSFDVAALNMTDSRPEHLLYTQFCAENLAFLEYDRTDEALLVLTHMDKVFANVGTSLAQTIENDVLRLNVESVMGPQAVVNGFVNSTSNVIYSDAQERSVDPHRLQQLSVSAQILMLIWGTRTLISKVWNLQKHIARAKKTTKDQESSKAPTRVPNASSLNEAYIQRTRQLASCAESPEAQRQICASFVDTISTDHEVKVGSGSDDDADNGNGIATPNDGRSTKSPSLPPSGGVTSRKRKTSGTPKGTPVKRRRSSVSVRRSESIKYDHGNDSEEDAAWAPE